MDNKKIEIKQEAKGSENTQIAQQINNYGIEPAEAVKMAFNLFQEYYPKLYNDALEETRRIVQEELERLPIKDIIPPKPKIVLPAMQNVSITEEPNLREMYAKLISSDMNRQKQSKVHPAYCEIINQLSTTDAALFKRIVQIEDSIPVARVTFTFDNKYLTTVLPHYFSPAFEGDDPWKVSLGIENLARLNIISFFEGSVNSFDYEGIKKHPFIQERFLFAKEKNPSRELNISIVKYVIQMNDFGRVLAEICL